MLITEQCKNTKSENKKSCEDLKKFMKYLICLKPYESL